MRSADTASLPSRTVPLLMVLVLCLSAFVQFTVASRSEFSNPLVSDAGRYLSYAYNLQHSGIYSQQTTQWDPTHDEGPVAPDKVRAPGYPAFLALVSDAEPTLAWARRIFLWQALFGVMTVGFTLLLAREVLPDSWALAVGVLTAISPHLATITAEILTESLFTVCLVAATWALVRADRTRSPRWAIGAGVLWGLASLVRPTAQFFPPLLLAAACLLPWLREQRRTVLLLFVAFAVVMAPWTLRNHTTALRSTKENLTVNFLHHGSYPDFMLEGQKHTLGIPYRYDPKSAVAGASIGGALANIAANFRAEPMRYARWYLVGKPTSLLSWNIVGGWGDIFTVRPDRSPYFERRSFDAMRVVMRALHAPLMWLGLLGTVLALGRWSRHRGRMDEGEWTAAGLVAALVAYALVLHVMGAPYPRYGIPFRPLMYLLALLPLALLTARLRSGRLPSPN